MEQKSNLEERISGIGLANVGDLFAGFSLAFGIGYLVTAFYTHDKEYFFKAATRLFFALGYYCGRANRKNFGVEKR